MAHTDTNTIRTNGLIERLGTVWAQYRYHRTQAAQYAATVREMNSLSDESLNDIGISRYDIRDLARQHVYGR